LLVVLLLLANLVLLLRLALLLLSSIRVWCWTVRRSRWTVLIDIYKIWVRKLTLSVVELPLLRCVVVLRRSSSSEVAWLSGSVAIEAVRQSCLANRLRLWRWWSWHTVLRKVCLQFIFGFLFVCIFQKIHHIVHPFGAF
jgi:hypothetical protein